MAVTPDPCYTSQRNPRGGACRIFDEARIAPLILEWQQTREETLFSQIVEGSLDLIQTIIRHHHFFDYDEVDALTNDCVLKLRKALPKFQPARGRAFSFISVAVKHYLICRAQRIGTYTKYHLSVEQEILENRSVDSWAPNERFSEFWPLLSKLETRFREPELMETQHRMVEHILSREGRLWHQGSGHGRLLRQLEEEYKRTHPELTRAQRRLVRIRLSVLYNYVVIQLRRLFYEAYAPKPLSRPADEKSGRLWDELGAETFTKLVYIFADIIPALNDLRPPGFVK
jgi:hypothetical protein